MSAEKVRSTPGRKPVSSDSPPRPARTRPPLVATPGWSPVPCGARARAGEQLPEGVVLAGGAAHHRRGPAAARRDEGGGQRRRHRRHDGTDGAFGAGRAVALAHPAARNAAASAGASSRAGRLVMMTSASAGRRQPAGWRTTPGWARCRAPGRSPGSLRTWPAWSMANTMSLCAIIAGRADLPGDAVRAPDARQPGRGAGQVQPVRHAGEVLLAVERLGVGHGVVQRVESRSRPARRAGRRRRAAARPGGTPAR